MAGIINRRDLDFQLFEVLDAEALIARPRYAEHSRETFNAVLDTALAMAEEKFAPHNRKADEHEPHFDGQRVSMIPEVAEALKAFCEAGFIAAAHDFERGGMQLPVTLTQAAFSLFKGANVGTAAYPFLTIANANVIHRFGSEAQRAKYLGPLLTGRFFGTMALTEPQAGSSLSDITTCATPNVDGTYSIVGNKIFISGGDHELSENIVHLVLAKIPGGPPGVKGISLFIVPKFRVNADGSLGERNDVALAGLIHKMGYRGTTSTLLSFGEQGQCVGELVGKPHQGLAYMFHMMNEARIGVGMGAVMLGYRGYLASLDYARERPQGRAPTNKNPADPQVKLIEHADIRRMLLAQKAYVEAGYALCLYCARLVDESRVPAGTQSAGADDTAIHEAGLLLDLLTPIAKSWPSQWCLEANSLAIQIHGGYGYTREYPVEQFYRDNRLNPIHEGTHGIQAIDLLGRKAVMQGGAAMDLFMREAGKTIAEAGADAALAGYAAELQTALDEIARTLAALAPVLAGNPTLALANAVLFLEAFGHTVMAWIWLRQALVAQRGLARGLAADAGFYRGKLAACRWFYRWELPKIRQWHELLRSLDDTTLTMPAASF
jgi:alkylation response protein AidB-like acyl-CoA dehydrogenase